MAYRIIFSRAADKDGKKLREAGLIEKVKTIIGIVREAPYQNPPAYENLVGDLGGIYSRRINIKHRFLYTVDDKEKTVHVLSMWTHYEGK